MITWRKHYPTLVMDALDQALPMLAAIKTELEFKPRLLRDFPKACGQGRVWQVGSISQRLPERIIEYVIAFQQQYRCLQWLVESVQFQEFMRTEQVKRAAARGIPVPARGVTPLPTSCCASKPCSRIWPMA